MPDTLAILDALFAHAPVGMALWDDELRYQRVNAALARIDGIAADAHLGRTPAEVLGSQTGAALEGVLRRVRESGEPLVDVAIDGNAALSAYPVPDGDGDLLGVAGIVRDVRVEDEATAERDSLLRDALTARAQAEAAQVRAEAARAETEAARRRTEFLYNAGARLAAVTIDYEATLREVVRIAVPSIADACTFTLLGPGGTLRTEPPDAPVPDSAIDALRTGESRLDREAHEITVPLTSRGRTLGALTLVGNPPERTYGEEDLRLAEILAARAGLAVENARLYAERSHIARTLQRSLLPPALPDVPGIELAARYRAAGDQNEVGGDFYDAFRGPGDLFTLLIGDVAGKGPEAAAVTSLTRHTLRALTLRGAAPVECLELLNGALLTEPSVAGRFCTVLYVRVAPIPSGGALLTLATGGHLPPRIRRADGRVQRVDVRGSIVGGLRTPVFDAADVELGPGDVLVLFTDGVTELRGHDAGVGERLLDELLASLAGPSPTAIVEAIEAQSVDAQAGEPRDDIALVALRPVAVDSA